MLANEVGRDEIRVGISACLIGQPVRYDGRHKQHEWLAKKLALQVHWVAVCPEVEFGLGVPRPPIELVRPGSDRARALRLFSTDTGEDLTEAMQRHAAARVDALVDERLSGYVFKTRSPSCGLTQVAVFARVNDPEPIARNGRGLFAEALIARFPGLPVIEEHQLDTADARAAFIADLRRYHELHHASHRTARA